MPAAEKSSLTPDTLPRRIALIAGSGELPARFLNACDSQDIETFVVAFKGQTDESVLKNRNHIVSRIGAAGTILETLRKHGIYDLVFLGGIRRPSLVEMRPDLRTTAFFIKLGFKALGDDGLLKAMRRELEGEGFRIHGMQAFMQDALTVEGPVGKFRPDKDAWNDIRFGASIAQVMGQIDIGQSVIVQEGLVLGVEAIEGTDELIRRCAHYKRQGRKPVLVKRSKPQQDRDLDLPTIGPDTILLCAQSGMAGIAIEAGASLILDPAKTAELADRQKIFIVGVDFTAPESYGQ
jgi:DUF1009 family protein